MLKYIYLFIIIMIGSISIKRSILISLSLPGTTIRRSGSAIITNGRNSVGTIGQNGSRISAASRNQLEPSPHELPVKDTDRAIDVTSVECEYIKIKRSMIVIISHSET